LMTEMIDQRSLDKTLLRGLVAPQRLAKERLVTIMFFMIFIAWTSPARAITQLELDRLDSEVGVVAYDVYKSNLGEPTSIAQVDAGYSAQWVDEFYTLVLTFDKETNLLTKWQGFRPGDGGGRPPGQFGNSVKGFLGNTFRVTGIAAQSMVRAIQQMPPPPQRERYVYKDKQGRVIGSVERE
jgi:hypothetical protein